MSQTAIDSVTKVAEPADVGAWRSIGEQQTGGHVAALDGIRGAAILLVMLIHGTMQIKPRDLPSRLVVGACAWGWVGVDLFFVLSGYLITGILLDAKGSPGFFRNFWARRVLRIFPLYYAYLILFFGIVAPFSPLEPGRMAEARSYQLWLWLYGTNILIALRGGYLIASLNFLWSLAVEEQFYLFWPLLVHRLDRRWMSVACLVLIAVAIASRVVLAGVPYAAHVLTICRLDSLAAGGFIAVQLRREGGLVRWRSLSWALLLGLGGLFASACALFPAWREAAPSYEAVVYAVLAACFGSVLLLAVTAPTGAFLRQVFEGRFLRFLGRYAYGLYIFNQPVCIVLQRSLPFSRISATVPFHVAIGVEVTLAIAGTIAVAFASYHLFEKRFLRLKRFFEYRGQPA